MLRCIYVPNIHNLAALNTYYKSNKFSINMLPSTTTWRLIKVNYFMYKEWRI